MNLSKYPYGTKVLVSHDGDEYTGIIQRIDREDDTVQISYPEIDRYPNWFRFNGIHQSGNKNLCVVKILDETSPIPEIKFLKDYKVGDTVTIQKADGKRVNGVIEEFIRSTFIIKYERYDKSLNTWAFSKYDGCFLENDFKEDFILAIDNLSRWESKPNEISPTLKDSTLDSHCLPLNPVKEMLEILENKNNFQPIKENKMRKTVIVELFDDDKGLEVQDSLVFRIENIVTEDSDQVTIQEVMMNNGIADYLNQHNEIRSMTVDLTILENTGKEVMLRPVKLKDLRWVVR